MVWHPNNYLTIIIEWITWNSDGLLIWRSEIMPLCRLRGVEWRRCKIINIYLKCSILTKFISATNTSTEMRKYQVDSNGNHLFWQNCWYKLSIFWSNFKGCEFMLTNDLKQMGRKLFHLFVSIR